MSRVIRTEAFVFSAFILQSCAAPGTLAVQPKSKAAPSDTDRIEYTISRCRGFCPAYSFAISADGNAHFMGNEHTQQRDELAVAGDPALFARIKAAIAPARPHASKQVISSEGCKVFVTDQQVVTVEWWSGGQAAQTLEFDLGCRDPDVLSVRSALAAARRLMPIDGLVGRATEF